MQCFRRSLSGYPFVCLFVCLFVCFFQCIGKVGKVKRIDDDGDVHISYGLLSWIFHLNAVIKVCTIYVHTCHTYIHIDYDDVCGIVLHGGMYR